MTTTSDEVQYYRELWKKEKSNGTLLSHAINEIKTMVNECQDDPIPPSIIQLIRILSHHKLL